MRKVLCASLCAFLGVCALGVRSAQASLILYEGFDYTAGQGLENQINNSVVGGAQDWDRAGSSATAAPLITSGSLTNPVPYQASPTGNKITIGGSVTTRAERLNFPNVSSGTIYYSILINPADIDGQFQNPATAAGVFSFAFNNGNTDAGTNTAPTVIGTRIQIRRDPSEATLPNGTKFNIGTLNVTGTTNWDPTQYTEGSTLMIVGSYEFVGALNGSDDIARLWINPDPTTFDPGTTTPNATVTGGDITNTGIQSIIVRQTGGQPTTMHLDEIRVGTTFRDVMVPEPASLGLLGVSAMGALSRRRRA
jgi:hypothetical protein